MVASFNERLALLAAHLCWIWICMCVLSWQPIMNKHSIIHQISILAVYDIHRRRLLLRLALCTLLYVRERQGYVGLYSARGAQCPFSSLNLISPHCVQLLSYTVHVPYWISGQSVGSVSPGTSRKHVHSSQPRFPDNGPRIDSTAISLRCLDRSSNGLKSAILH